MRFAMIDGIRGHLLIGMLVAHMSFIGAIGWTGWFHHKRLIGLFDAEFFIPLAGFLVGYLFIEKMKDFARFGRFLGRRMALIYRYYLIAAVPFLVFAVARNGVEALPQSILSVLTVQRGGAYSDILPIYLYCFALLLPIGWLVARMGARVVVPISVAIYAVAFVLQMPGFFGLSGGLVWFNIAAWQLLFCVAFKVGVDHRDWGRRIAALSRTRYNAALAVSVALVAALTILPSDAFPLLPAEQNNPNAWVRQHLHPFYLLHTVAAIVAFTLLLLRREPGTARVGDALRWYVSLPILRVIGTYSIQMFTLHVYLIALLMWLAPITDRGTMAVVAVGVFAAFIAAGPAIDYVKRGRLSRAAA